MNIFVTNEFPAESAICLPDKHIVKMPLECCQMLSIVASKWYHNYGTLPKSDGTPYSTEKGAFRNHPCTQWAAKSIHNAYWLIKHGMNLCIGLWYMVDLNMQYPQKYFLLSDLHSHCKFYYFCQQIQYYLFQQVQALIHSLILTPKT